MSEVACWLTIEESICYTERIEQLRENNTTNRVDGIYTNLEVGIFNSLDIYELQSKYGVDMALVECIVFCIFSEMIYICIIEVFLLSDVQHLVTVSCSKELTLLVEELEGIPLAWIVRSCDDDTAGCTTHGNSKFGGRSSSQTDVQHIVAHTHESSTNHILYHLARDARITAYNDGITLRSTATANEGSVC